jgi:signal transduction histidine kinase
MNRKRWLILILPSLVTLVAAFALSATPHGSRDLTISIELDTSVLFAGLTVSVLIAAIMLVRVAVEAGARKKVAAIQNEMLAERQRFLQRLDHEFKNPLTAIRAGLANLASSTNASDIHKARSSVESQVIRLSRLTADLRKLADLESHPLEEHRAVDMGTVIQEVFETFENRPEAADRKLSLSLPNAPWPLPPVEGDRDLLYLALFNLLDNAIKFSGAGDAVEIRAFEDGTNVVIEVADTGMGIPDNEIRYVWQNLYRSQDAHGIPGSGLGLPIVRAIIEQHGGATAMRSKPKHGTVITLRLPAMR